MSQNNLTSQGRADEKPVPETVETLGKALIASRQGEHKYHRLFMEMVDGAAFHEILCDEAGNPVDYITLEVNHAYELNLNVDRNDAIGRKASEILPKEELEKWVAIFGPIALGGDPAHYEMYSPHNERYFEGSVYSPAAGTFVVSFHDVTQSKRAEAALQEYNIRLEREVEARTYELQSAQEQLVQQERLDMLGQVAGSIGHELRNPLGVISNAVYFLRLVQPDANEKVKEYLGIIDAETHSAEKIITGLLDFARIKSVVREPVSAPELVRQTLNCYPAPPLVEVALELPLDLPFVYVDPPQVVQALGNLVVNACQAMPKGGRLTLSARSEGQMVVISIMDTGVGIPPENMGKLFEPLFTTRFKGIGLGLAVSRKLVEANDGRIEAHSELGKGSAFTVYLPIVSEAG